MDMDSWSGLLGGRKDLARGGAPFVMDWNAARRSVEKLAKLQPTVAGCGHGRPMHDAGLPDRLKNFAERFRAPRHGRYVDAPAVASEAGIMKLPPAPFDPVPLATAAALLATGIALGSGYLEEQLRDS